MKKGLLVFLSCLMQAMSSFATGEPSTYFNIYVPPSNVMMGRDVCLIVTALYDSTYFTITDDGADGDTDDTKTGMLMQGQSYVLFIRNNGVNDDAPHSGESATKNDGDYFIITSSKLLFASQATLSDWQHDWVSSFNKSSKGQKFIVYSNATSSSPNDINVFAYEDSTEVIIRKISTTPLTGQGYTSVSLTSDQIIVQKWVNVGQDLIYSGTEGRNVLASGCTYMIESTKPVTVQYGALYQNQRDGGGYVPSSNGSSSGELFYFGVPYQTANEQEIRMVSWDEDNEIQLDRYLAGSWVNVATFSNVDSFKPVQWIGATAGQTYATVFRVTCTPGKRVSVFEANWLETGSPATSDIATMASSGNGTSSGNDFVIYMPPPSTQSSMTNPFTGTKHSQNTHAYVYAKDSTVVTIKDVYTNGADLSRTYTIPAGRYADVNLSMNDWKSIYNGTGTTAGGPERPYLYLHASSPVAVMIANTNDNWMMYFGSSLPQSFTQSSLGSTTKSSPGDSVFVATSLNITGGSSVTGASVKTTVTEGALPVSSVLVDATAGTTQNGTILANTGKGTDITFPSVTTLDSTHDYTLLTTIVMTALGTDELSIIDNEIVSVETYISGTINGTFQQSSSTVGIANKASNTGNYHFSKITTGTLVTDATDSWNSCWTDINGDNYPDLLVCSYSGSQSNKYYQNNGNGTFSTVSKGDLTGAKSVSTLSGVFADLDNDGINECITSNNTDKATFVFKKDGAGNYNKINAGALTTDRGYGQTVNVVDYDNDGKLDVFIAEYFPTNMCRLYHNDGGNLFSRINTSELSKIGNYTIGSTWADYDNDGRPDLLVPVGGTVSNPFAKNNLLFHNDGNGRFTQITSGAVVTDAGNSTGSTWGDYDNDGHLDLFVSNASMQKNCLYHNNGNGTFSKIDTGAIVNDLGNWHGCSWVDYDNDGWLDIYVVTNDSLRGNKLYHNEKNGYFRNAGQEVLCAITPGTMGTSWGDFDRDGYQDLYVATTGDRANLLYHNNGGANRWINITLAGSASNRNAIGARVSIKCTISGTAVWQTREITSTSGIGSQNAVAAAFGLGNATVVDSITVRWPSGTLQHITGQGSNQFLLISEPSTGTISGKVFLDGNSNCNHDVGELGIGNILLRVNPGNVLVNTDIGGNYTIKLPVGTYTVTRASSAWWASYCGESRTATIVAVNTVYSGNDIGVYATIAGADMSVNTGATAFRRGFENDMVITYANKGGATATGNTVALTFPAGITPTAALPSWTSVAGSKYTWSIDDLAPGGTGAIRIAQTIPLSYAIGDVITYTSEVSTATTDGNSENDFHTYSMNIVGAIDPNELLVSPAGEGVQGYIPDSQMLHYTVQFENVGSYEAENVTIADSLPEYLDLSSFRMEQSSHTCHFQLNGRSLQVFFDHIKLPFSKFDSVLSNGFVTFSLKPQNGIMPGAGIPNKANIIFDFEEPLATGDVLNTIYPQSMVNKKNKLFVYPNPTANECTVAATDYISGIELNRLQVFSMTGALLMDSPVSGTKVRLNTALLAKSTSYMVRAYDAAGNQYAAVVSVMERK